MRRTEREALGEYLLNKLIWLENDLTRCRDTVRYRDADEVDCMELMIARIRLHTFKEVSHEIANILKLYDGKGGGKDG